MPDRGLWVVIPCYNESARIAGVIKLTKRYASHIVVVDDGSRDNTAYAARAQGVHVLRHMANLGLGDGLKTGCDYAVSMGAARIVTLDGDGQHDPSEIPKLVAKLDKGYQVVFGGRPINSSMPAVKRLGNLVIFAASNLLFGIKVKDTQTGFRAFTADAYRKIRWESQRYSVAAEMVVNTKLKGIRHTQVDVKTIYHDKFKGTGIIDGIRIVYDILMWRVKSWICFR